MRVIEEDEVKELKEEVKKELEERKRFLQEGIDVDDKAVDYLKDKDIKQALKEPVILQKELVLKLKSFIDKKIQDEMKEKGFLTEYTRKWVKDYSELINNLIKNTKDETTNVFKINLSQINMLINKYGENDNSNNK